MEDRVIGLVDALQALLAAARGIEQDWEHNLAEAANVLRETADECQAILDRVQAPHRHEWQEVESVGQLTNYACAAACGAELQIEHDQDGAWLRLFEPNGAQEVVRIASRGGPIVVDPIGSEGRITR